MSRGSVPGDRDAGAMRGSAAYRRLLIALFCAGIATFAQLYAPQSVLPVIARDVGVSPDTAALCISIATGALAIGVIPWAIVASRVGRARTISVALSGSAVIGCAVPFAPTFALLIAGRALEGFLLAAVPAVAVAYLAEQVHVADMARAAGVYVAGTTVGGLLGRVVSGPLAEVFDWRFAMFAVAIGGVMAVLLFVLLAPRRPVRQTSNAMRGFLPRLLRSVRTRPLLQLHVQPFLLMGAFVALYNYLGFRLEAAPFALSAIAVSLLYFSYLAGTVAAARAGSLIQRFGFKRTTLLAELAMVVGLVAMFSSNVVVIVAGLVVCTAGFFATHAALTAWTPLAAGSFAAEASTAYSLSYYLGSSVIGWAAGLVLAGLGWSFTVAALIALVGLSSVFTATTAEPRRV